MNCYYLSHLKIYLSAMKEYLLKYSANIDGVRDV